MPNPVQLLPARLTFAQASKVTVHRLAETATWCTGPLVESMAGPEFGHALCEFADEFARSLSDGERVLLQFAIAAPSGFHGFDCGRLFMVDHRNREFMLDILGRVGL